MNDSDILQFFRNLFKDEFLSKAFLLSVVMGTVTAAVLYGRKLITFCYSRIERMVVFSVRIEQTDELFWMLESWLYQNYDKKYRNVISFLSRPENNPPDEVPKPESSDNDNSGLKKVLPPKISFRQNEDFIIIKYRYGWIKVRKGRDKLENASSLTSLFFDSFILKALFGTKNIKMLLQEVVMLDHMEKTQKQVNYLYLCDANGYWEKRGTIRGKNIKNIFLPDKDKARILDDLNRFLDNREWYEKRGIPYKRGYLFYGPPGNGKTSLALSLANFLERNIYVINLPSLYGDEGLIRAFGKTSSNSIVLMEDIDTVFKTRRKTDIKLSFSTLLNCLDGVFYRDGIITIMTTNCIDKLDSALTRSGRVDIALFIDHPISELMKKYVNNFFETNVYSDGEMLPIMDIAELQNLCFASDASTIREKLKVKAETIK